jgi:hypothetical protein
MSPRTRVEERLVRRGRGHWCWSCQQTKPNEAFSGRNHGRHLCRACASQRRRAARDPRKRATAAVLAPADARPTAPMPEVYHRQVPGLPGLDDEWAWNDPHFEQRRVESRRMAVGSISAVRGLTRFTAMGQESVGRSARRTPARAFARAAARMGVGAAPAEGRRDRVPPGDRRSDRGGSPRCRARPPLGQGDPTCGGAWWRSSRTRSSTSSSQRRSASSPSNTRSVVQAAGCIGCDQARRPARVFATSCCS